LLRFESTGWSMIKTLIWLTVGVYLLLGPFISGGLLSAYQKGHDQWDVFWSGGSRFYFPFLKLNLLIGALLAFLALILSGIGFFFSTYGLENFVSEVPVLVGVAILLFILILDIIFLVSVSTKTKWNMIKNDDKAVWRNFKLGLKSIKSRKGFYLLLGLVFLIISLLFAFFSNTLINCITESGFFLVLLAFLLQLSVLFFRVFLRNAYHGALIEE